MRLKNSFYNVFMGIGNSIVINLLSFISRTVFIYYLDASYLGVNGIMYNILSVLSLTELGVGIAINYSLYKPLADKDYKKVSVLMSFYKKAYIWIGATIFVLGICVIPFLDILIKDSGTVNNLVLIYMLFLLDTTISYLFTYKRTLINADQAQYKIVKFQIIFRIVLFVSQTMVLVLFKNYILYLLCMIIVRILENIIVNVFINKEYSNVSFTSKEKLDKFEMKKLKDNIIAVMFHKVGDVAVNSTDNLILSSFVGIIEVGIYSNYLLILGVVKQFINVIYNGITASLGNLIVTTDENRRFEIFNVMNFISYWIFIFSSVSLLFLFNPFIKVWIGEEYIFNINIVIAIVLNFYITSVRIPIATIKNAAGIYRDDKYVPLIQAVMNLFLSIILVKGMGIIGIFIGTIITSLILPSWYRPYLVYKKIFSKSSKIYFVGYIKNLLILSCIIIFMNALFKLIYIESGILEFLFKLFMCIIIPNMVMYIVNRKTDEFKYVKNILKGYLNKNE
ncbi:MAG: lipopolysaccharide biosynthesis protein [Clostridium sp.]